MVRLGDSAPLRMDNTFIAILTILPTMMISLSIGAFSTMGVQG